MNISAIIVFINFAMFFVLGVAFLFWPKPMASYVRIQLDHPTALTDVRATYGGFELGVAAFLII